MLIRLKWMPTRQNPDPYSFSGRLALVGSKVFFEKRLLTIVNRIKNDSSDLRITRYSLGITTTPPIFVPIAFLREFL